MAEVISGTGTHGLSKGRDAKPNTGVSRLGSPYQEISDPSNKEIERGEGAAERQEENLGTVLSILTIVYLQQ